MLGVETFIPKYPNRENELNSIYDLYDGENFNQVLFRKKEFYDLKLTTEQPKDPEDGGVYYNHQKIIARFLASSTLYDELLLYHMMGVGKCLQFDTDILLYNGYIEKVQNIKVGDFLMGDDSTPRMVTSLARGKDDMYDIIPIKGDKYTVNSEHILVLKVSSYPTFQYSNHKQNTNYQIQWVEENRFCCKTFTYNDSNKREKEVEAKVFYETIRNIPQIIEISVVEYLKLPQWRKNILKGYRTGVEFPEKDLPIDPYMIGYWLGDGDGKASGFTSQDSTVLHYFNKNAHKYNLSLKHYSQYDYRLTGGGKKDSNVFLNTLQNLNLIKNKHIPHIYKCNSRKNRLLLLAGLLDSDGHYSNGTFEFTQKNETVMNDVIYVARSLGFAAYKKIKKTSWTYKGVKKYGTAFRTIISGEGLDEIPTLIHRKHALPRKQKKDVLVTSIKVEYAGKDDYYGFTIDGNERFLLGDFTVTHNTCTAIGAIENVLHQRIGPINHNTIKKAYMILPSSQFISRVYDEIIFTCTGNKYIETLPGDEELTPSELRDAQSSRARRHISKFYILSTHEMFYADNKSKTQKQLSEQYSNSVFVIDEVHKISTSETKYEWYNMFLHSLTNRKILLLTGTPMKNSSSEIANVMNLILPIELQFKDFSKDFLYANGIVKENKVEELSNIFTGRVSYLKSKVDIDYEYIGNYKDSDVSFPLSQNLMSTFQDQSYALSITNMENVDEKNNQSFYQNSLQASLFVYPDGSYGNSGFMTYIKRDKNSYRAQFLRKIPGNIEQKLQKIREYSSKYANIIENILNNPDQNFFVYTTSIEGSGAIVFGLCLELFGYNRAIQRRKQGIRQEGDIAGPGKRYAILSEKTGTNFKDVLSSFNSKNNKNGKFIQILIGGEAVREGITFYSLQQIHVITPEWNFSNMDQAIARGIRMRAHRYFDSKTLVKIYLHASISRLVDFNVDIKLYQISQLKDFGIKAIEYIMKVGSFDCALTYDRNVDKNGENTSRECEYTDCLYRCKGINTPYFIEESHTYSVDNKDLYKDTYQLYYEDQYRDQLIELLQSIFNVQFSITLWELIDYFNKNYTFYQIFQSLNSIINLSIIFKNKYGLPSYLHEENNVLFLSNNIRISTTFLSSYYNQFPSLREHTRFVDTVDYVNSSEESINEQINEIINLPVNEQTQRIPILPKIAQESFIENSISTNASSELSDWVIQYYRDYISEEKEYMYSSFLERDVNITRRFEYGTGQWTSIARRVAQINNDRIDQLSLSELGVFGIIRRNKFTIVDLRSVPRENRAHEGRKRGKVCTTWEIPALKEIGRLLDNDVDWNMTKTNLCNTIQQLFIDKNLMV